MPKVNLLKLLRVIKNTFLNLFQNWEGRRMNRARTCSIYSYMCLYLFFSFSKEQRKHESKFFIVCHKKVRNRVGENLLLNLLWNIRNQSLVGDFVRTKKSKEKCCMCRKRVSNARWCWGKPMLIAAEVNVMCCENCKSLAAANPCYQ